MLVEDRWYVVLRGLRSADLLALGLCVLHSAANSVADHGQLQLRKDATHLDECLAHGVDLALPAIHRDAAHDHQPKVLVLHDIQYLAQLLGAAAQTADFHCDDRISGFSHFQEHIEVFLHLGVAVFIFEDHFVCASGFQLADLAINILFILVGAATCVAICFHCSSPSVNKRVDRRISFRLPVLFTEFRPF